jgi:hypothetical protein
MTDFTEENGATRNPTPSRFAEKVIPIECVTKRFRPEIAQQRMLIRVFSPQERTEPAGVPKTHRLACLHLDIDVVVFCRGFVVIDNAHAAGHAKMQHGGAYICIE